MFYKPMLMTEREEPFDDARYVFEPMIDGHRLQLEFIEGKPKLLTRHNNDVTPQYPELHNVPLVKPADVVLDGEVAYVNPDTGAAEFRTLIERYRLKKGPAIRDARKAFPVLFFVFDVLYYDGADLRGKPLHERKELLHFILEDNDYYKKLLYIEGAGKELFELVKKSKLEGMVCKRKDSLYEEGQADGWLKVTNPEYLRLHDGNNSFSNAG